MKGVVLCGGSGSRLDPITRSVSKHLLPIFSVPMVYFPITTLMFAGIREILLISTPQDLPSYRRLFGDGSQFGISIQYAEQPEPGGIAQAFLIGEKFIGEDSVTLILGDNVFYGSDLPKILRCAVRENKGATVFGHEVKDPERYGVAAFSHDEIYDIEEKPKEPKSNIAISGLYIYNNKVVRIAKDLKPSDRGELEITDVNKYYVHMRDDNGKRCLKLVRLGRGIAWFDTGTPKSLLEASNFVEAIETRQGFKLAAIEEVAYRMHYIDEEQLRTLAREMKNPEYRAYLEGL